MHNFTDCVVNNGTAVWEDKFCMGGTGVYGPSSGLEGSNPSGPMFGLQPSDAKRHRGRSCAHIPTDLHGTFAVHPNASNG